MNEIEYVNESTIKFYCPYYTPWMENKIDESIDANICYWHLNKGLCPLLNFNNDISRYVNKRCIEGKCNIEWIDYLLLRNYIGKDNK